MHGSMNVKFTELTLMWGIFLLNGENTFEVLSAQRAWNGDIVPLFYTIGRKFKDNDF